MCVCGVVTKLWFWAEGKKNWSPLLHLVPDEELHLTMAVVGTIGHPHTVYYEIVDGFSTGGFF